MSVHLKIRANTQYAFICIGLMLAAFLVFVAVSVLPLGLNPVQYISTIRLALYAVVFFAILGGIFSIRVAVLRKKIEK